MTVNSKIETTNHTWTPVVGCDPKSPACANCYAAPMAARLEAMGNSKYAGLAVRNGAKGKWTGKVNLSYPDLLAPLLKKKAGRWFLTSMGDVAHEAVPDDFLYLLFAIMAASAVRPGHTFFLLTKRIDRLRHFLTQDPAAVRIGIIRALFELASGEGLPIEGLEALADRLFHASADGIAAMRLWPLPNVLIGCTVEDQTRADERVSHMRAISEAGWRTVVSYEPTLGPVDWSGWEFLRWLIDGGESGPGARRSQLDWHRSTRDWCGHADVDYTFKQWGSWCPVDQLPEETRQSLAAKRKLPETGMVRVGKKAAGRLLDGVIHDKAPDPVYRFK